MCVPGLKFVSRTTSGKQCGPQVASAPFVRVTVAVGGGLLGGGLLGGRVVERDVDGCGAADVDAGRVDDGRVELGAADVERCAEAVGDGVRDFVADADTESDRVGCPDADDPSSPGAPNGTLDSSTGLLTIGIDPAVRRSPPPLFNNQAAPPAPSRQTSSTSSATRPTATEVVASVSSPARNAPQPAQTNSSSASRPHRGQVAISRIQWHVRARLWWIHAEPG